MELNAIKQMERIAVSQKGSVSLAQGIPSIPTHKQLHEAAIKAMESGLVDRYVDPQGLILLRRKISDSLALLGMNYSIDDLVITAGAIEGLSAILKVVITPEKSKIIVPTPVYGAYFKVVEVAKGEALQVPLIEKDGWRLDVDAMIANMSADVSAILICNPNNPTGTVHEQADLDKLAAEASRRGIKVIIDEVYSNMILSNARHYSLASNSLYRDVVIRVMSFSKDFSLTGWRVGYVHGPSDIIRKVTAVHDTLVNCAPVISQYVACEALRLQDEVIMNNKRVYRNHYAIMSDILLPSPHISFVKPEAGYCIFARIHSIGSIEEFCFKLARQGVMVVPGSAFGMGGEHHIRLCFGRSAEDVTEGSRRIVNYLKEEM